MNPQDNTPAPKIFTLEHREELAAFLSAECAVPPILGERFIPRLEKKIEGFIASESAQHLLAVEKLKDALREIAAHEIDGPVDEWAEAAAYSRLKIIALNAIRTLPAPQQSAQTTG